MKQLILAALSGLILTGCTSLRYEEAPDKIQLLAGLGGFLSSKVRTYSAVDPTTVRMKE